MGTIILSLEFSERFSGLTLFTGGANREVRFATSIGMSMILVVGDMDVRLPRSG